MVTLLKIRDIRFSRHELDKFISMFLYFPGINSTNRPAYTHFYKKFHIVEVLKANLLVNNDILAIKRVIIDLANKSAIILNCQMIIFITAKPRGQPVQRKMLVDRSLIIPPEFEALMQFVYSSFLDNQDFLFNPIPHSHLILFSHILNNLTCRV